MSSLASALSICLIRLGMSDLNNETTERNLPCISHVDIVEKVDIHPHETEDEIIVIVADSGLSYARG